VANNGFGDSAIYFTSGLDNRDRSAPPRLHAGLLGRVMVERRAWRMSNSDGRPIDVGLPQSYPPAGAFLAAPLISLKQTYGWLYLADKIGADAFS